MKDDLPTWFMWILVVTGKQSLLLGLLCASVFECVCALRVQQSVALHNSVTCPTTGNCQLMTWHLFSLWSGVLGLVCLILPFVAAKGMASQ